MENPTGWETSRAEQEARDASYSKINFLTLSEGENVLRLYGSYIFRYMHYYPEGRMHHIVCPGLDKCPLCQLGKSPDFRYYINVLDRKDDKIKILRFGTSIKDKVSSIVKHYGRTEAYDIIIEKKVISNKTSYPSVFVPRESKLISEPIRLYVEKSLYNLEEVFKTPTTQEVQEAMLPRDVQPTSHSPYPSTSSPMISNVGPTVTPHQFNQPIQTAQSKISTIEEGRKIKTCFGDPNFYQPMRPECSSCHIISDCKPYIAKYYQNQV